MEPAETVDPDPASLVESLRDFGYTLPSALADLIDNSITAGAKRIQLAIDAASGDEHIAVVDDGSGMALQKLVDAMRMGTNGPSAPREASDLGRFGLGLKTASLSQGCCLTVISKSAGAASPIIRRWDLHHIQQSRRWELLRDPTPTARPYVDRIQGMTSGSAVVVERLDRASFLRVGSASALEHLSTALSGVRQHLEMTFHRFISDGVEIRLGSTTLKPWDPFMRPASKALPGETLPFCGTRVSVSPFVLPHHSKITEEEHERGAGSNGWNAHQGFYIYRCGRLIVPGTWLNLHLKKEEHFKLARIMVDLPNGLDAEWQLNVIKSHVAAPAALKDDFARIARDVRRDAANVYRYRGERQVPPHPAPERHMWRRKEGKTAVRYIVDRSHPVVRSLLLSGCGHDELLEAVLRLVESTVPIATMLQEPAKALDGIPGGEVTDIEQLMKAFFYAENFLIRTGKAPEEARDKVLQAEPFAQNSVAIKQYLEAGPPTTQGVQG